MDRTYAGAGSSCSTKALIVQPEDSLVAPPSPARSPRRMPAHPGSSPVPPWALTGSFSSVTSTPTRFRSSVAEDAVPVGVRAERGWQALMLVGPFDFGLTGVLAAVAGLSPKRGVPIFALSTFDTDYVLVKAERVAARTVMLSAGHFLRLAAAGSGNLGIVPCSKVWDNTALTGASPREDRSKPGGLRVQAIHSPARGRVAARTGLSLSGCGADTPNSRSSHGGVRAPVQEDAPWRHPGGNA